MNEKLYSIKGSYIVSEENIPLNKRERHALDIIVKECQKYVDEKGYPNSSWNEATAISQFIVTRSRSKAKPWRYPPSEPIFGMKGNVYITFDCLHDKADQFEENELSRILLFPNATFDYTTLNAACLFFDKVYVVFPDEAINVAPQDIGGTSVPTKKEYHLLGDYFPSTRIGQDIEDFVKQVYSFFDRTFPLRREGVLNLISPSKQISKEFFRSIENDLTDPDFDQVVSSHSSPPYILGGSKGLLLHRLSSFNKKGEYISISKIKNFSTNNLLRFFQETNLTRWEFGHWGFIRVSPQLGASILTNQSLLACSNRGLLPFTDNSLFFDLLLYKCRKIDKSSHGEIYKLQHSITETLMAKEVMHEHIPLLYLKSCEDVLEIRERYKDVITNFRKSIRHFASKMQAMPYSRDFYREIESIIATEINPVIEELRLEMRSIPQKFLRSTIKGLKAGTIPLIAATFAGLPIPYLLALSAGIVAIETFVDLSLEMKKKPPKNGLCFLLKVK